MWKMREYTYGIGDVIVGEPAIFREHEDVVRMSGYHRCMIDRYRYGN